MELTGFYSGFYVSNILRRSDTGSVLGIFHGGWYITFGDGILLIYDRSYGHIPNGIGIEGFSQYGLYPKHLEGAAVIVQNHVLRMGDFTILLREEEARPCLPMYVQKEDLLALISYAETEASAFPKGELRYMLAFADTLLRGVFPEWEMQDSPLFLAMGRATSRLMQAIDAGDGALLEETLRRMLGLGGGLTPSMDDWLNGFVYTGKRIAMAEHDRQTFQQLCYKLELLLTTDITNPISASYLRATIIGEHYDLLDQVLFRKELVPQHGILDIGSSSGMDMLTGMAFACRYYCGR